jgi:beta-phosphoglucomutase-like phosphatase (HAD superfamily)
VDFTLEHTGIGPYFQTILDDSFVTKGKPDPQIYLKSAAALNIDPKNCVVFEDSLSGVMAGKAAGCKVVGLTTTHTNEELSATDFNIDSFNIEPKSILERLF